MRAIITVGLGFGDEGKGGCVDYLAHGPDTLVVRYCGGFQAAHNVETATGQRHTFSQFGSGTLNGCPTYLGPNMIVNRQAMLAEAKHLEKLGCTPVISAHPDCLVTTYYHRLANVIAENSRKEKHGSCGVGIGATRDYSLKFPEDAIRLFDGPRTQLDKLRKIQARYVELFASAGIKPQQEPAMHLMMYTTPEELLDVETYPLPICDKMLTKGYELIVFEGSQGVLLDENYGFHPHTTWSTVTPKHAIEMLDGHQLDSVAALGITRAYMTRHGHGPFPTEGHVPGAEIGNLETSFRGAIRSGCLDLPLLKYAKYCCEQDGIRVEALAVTCLDHIGGAADGPLRKRQPIADCCVRYDLSGLNDPTDALSMLTSVWKAKPIIERHDIVEKLCDEVAPALILSYGPRASDKVLAPDKMILKIKPNRTF